ncbi:hypothetical protein AKJ16_DCAP15845 [Drosera capensis]
MFASMLALDMLDACPASSAFSNPAREASSCTASDIFSVQATTSISKDATAGGAITSASQLALSSPLSFPADFPPRPHFPPTLSLSPSSPCCCCRASHRHTITVASLAVCATASHLLRPPSLFPPSSLPCSHQPSPIATTSGRQGAAVAIVLSSPFLPFSPLSPLLFLFPPNPHSHSRLRCPSRPAASATSLSPGSRRRRHLPPVFPSSSLTEASSVVGADGMEPYNIGLEL